MKNQKTDDRLASLDILRGFDLFCLVLFQPVFMSLVHVLDWGPTNWIAIQFEHVAWEGFAFWDIIMPLFMFMAGASMPFAFAKYLKSQSKKRLYMRILKRVLLLWLFGMMCQGNILGLNPDRIFLFSNTLQSIAIGYLVSAILLIHLSRKGQIIVTASCLTAFWALLSFVKIDGFGGGNFTPDYNLAEYIDRIVLGRFRDGTTITLDGAIDFGQYRYTWILSSLNFVVTVMTGVFAGQILKSNNSGLKKTGVLCIVGVSMIIAGQLLGLYMPIIKKIWSSSMTLHASGICFLLMALFYYVIDYKKCSRYLNWLKIYGMNSIIAYLLYSVINFRSVTTSLLHGTEQYLGDYYSVILRFGNCAIVFLILWIMYRNKIFLKV